MSPPQENIERILNINVGVLGHVDSGKTSLVKTLSTLLSTASLDKSAQSRQRGITLDLGFSAFFLDDIPPQIACANPDVRKIQITLVDCPGHASLIRTIIGGAQIIDMMILVVDATKGLQTQTAECLVIAEMTTKNLIVALNKIDLFPPDDRVSKVKQVEGRIRSALRSTRFVDAPMVGISACVGGEKVAAVGEEKHSHTAAYISTNIDGLLQLVKKHVPPPNRNYDKGNQPFHFAIDHCFPIKGQGTVITGTALNGSAKPNDFLQFPELGIERKIKSMQMFRRPVTEVHQGDRAGICIANLDAKLIERGVASTPGTVSLVSSAIAVVRKVNYFNGRLQSNAKFHVSVGHNTVMASVIFFGAKELAEKTILAEEEDHKGGPSASLGGSSVSGLPRLKFNFDDDFVFQNELIEDITSPEETEAGGNDSKLSQKKRGVKYTEMPLNLAILHFQTPVFCPLNSLVIGSRLDTDIHANTCRLAFSGRLIEKIDPKKDVPRFKFYSRKEKEGVICRLGESYMREKDKKVVRYEIFGVDLFKKETNMNLFVGLKVETSSGDIGTIHSSFGTSGKFRMNFPAGTDEREGDKIFLRFKRYANDSSKSMHQDTVIPDASPGVLLVPEKKVKKEKKKNAKKKNGNTKQDPKASLGTVTHEGIITSLKPNSIAIVSGFFSPEVNIREKVGWKVVVPGTNEEGAISAPFGKAGKCKVSGLSAEEGATVQLVPPAD